MPPTSYVHSDQPQKDPEHDDKFGYADMARLIAKGIHGYAGIESLVLGLYGEWGCGKSTMLNFVAYYLEHPEKLDRPEAAPQDTDNAHGTTDAKHDANGDSAHPGNTPQAFQTRKTKRSNLTTWATFFNSVANPMMVVGGGAILFSFLNFFLSRLLNKLFVHQPDHTGFSAMEVSLISIGMALFLLALISKWYISYRQCYRNESDDKNASSHSTPLQIIRFNPWWFPEQNTDLLRAFFGQLQAQLDSYDALIPELKIYAEALGKLPGYVGGFGNAIAALARPADVSALKQEIAKQLEHRGQRFLIMIDEIDRLHPAEINQLFTVIKAVADFPNMLYLLAMERDVVAQVIQTQHGLADIEAGRRYLEKIIQVPFDMPVINVELYRRIGNPIYNNPKISWITHVADKAQFYDGQEERDKKILKETLPFIRTPRDIIRIKNVLSLTCPALKHDVNIYDFLSIEVLRIFHPEIYEKIRHNREILTLDEQGASQEEYSKFIEQLPGKFHSLIKALFTPRNRNINCIIKRKCIYARPIFDSYFQFNPTVHSVGIREIHKLLESDNRLEVIKKELKSSDSYLIYHLKEHGNNLDEKHCIPFIEALLDVGDDLFTKHHGPKKNLILLMEEKPVCRESLIKLELALLGLITLSGLRTRSQKTEEAIIKGIKEGHAISLQLILILSDKSWHNDSVHKGDSKELYEMWANRVSELAESEQDKFLDHPYFPAILQYWHNWSEDKGDKAKSWLDEAIKDSDKAQKISNFFHTGFQGEIKSKITGNGFSKILLRTRISNVTEIDNVFPYQISNFLSDQKFPNKEWLITAFQKLEQQGIKVVFRT